MHSDGGFECTPTMGRSVSSESVEDTQLPSPAAASRPTFDAARSESGLDTQARPDATSASSSLGSGHGPGDGPGHAPAHALAPGRPGDDAGRDQAGRPADRPADAPASDTTGTDVAAELRRLLADRIGEARVERWLGDAELKIDDRGLEVRTSRPLAKRMLDQTMARELREAASTALGRDASVRIAIAPPESAPTRGAGTPVGPKGPRPDAGSAAARQDTAAVPGGKGIRPSTTTRPSTPADSGLRDLDGFVVGTSNRLAWTAAMQTGDPREIPPAGMLFLHGDCGVGKTHLLQGLCRRFRQIAAASGMPARVRYVTGEQFTNEFIAAVRDHTIDRFRERVRRLDLLAIDDIHFLENKVRTQNELLHTLDAIGLTGARIALASDGHPTVIRRCSRGLVNRFLSGMVIEVERPDRETRRLIARRLAEFRSMRVGEAAIEAIASRCVGSVREIEGAVTKIAAMHQLIAAADAGPAATGREIGLTTVERVLHDASARPARPVQLSGIVDAACNRLDISRTEIVGGSRKGRASLGRSVVSFLAKEMTPASYPEIARGLGLASHASVHRAVQTTRRRVDGGDRVRDVDGGQVELRELIDQVRHAAAAGAGRPTGS